MVLGLIVAGAVIVGMQLPFLHKPATVVIAAPTSAVRPVSPAVAWPTIGSAAIDIPALGVLESHRNAVVPIASLAKLMTAYVTLKKFPLGIGETGPCVTVSAADVTTWLAEKANDESSVIVQVGEQLCESVLLNGMLVHSAGNYADLLATMVSGSTGKFVALMNETAASLGLSSTHYGDDAGISDNSVSTALDQAKLAVLLMRSPLVRSIVQQSSVDLPVAGIVNSFTPYVGTDNVVGVKSGRTDLAGGCDVMALDFRQGGRTRIAYVVVLGQRGGDLLTPAGDAAYALATTAVANRFTQTFQKNGVVGHIGWGHELVPFAFKYATTIYHWGPKSIPSYTMRIRRITTDIRRGDIVGWVHVDGVRRPLPLVALRSVAAPTLWHRLL